MRRPIWLAGLALVTAAFTGAHLPELPYADAADSVAGPVAAQPLRASAPLDPPEQPSSAALAPEGAAGPALPSGAAVTPEPAASPQGPSSAAPAPEGAAEPGTRPVAAVAAVTAVTAAAPAATCSGAGWQQRRGQAALAALTPAPVGGYSLAFLPAKDGFLGLTRPSLQAVEVYVRPCATESDALLAHVLAHELGHAWDKSRLSAAQRTAWLAARGIPAGTPWQGCNRCTDFATPAGDFAEVYAQWRTGQPTNRSQLGGAPSAAELDRLAAQFFR